MDLVKDGKMDRRTDGKTEGRVVGTVGWTDGLMDEQRHFLGPQSATKRQRQLCLR